MSNDLDGDFFNVSLYDHEKDAKAFLEAKYPNYKIKYEMAIIDFGSQEEVWRSSVKIKNTKHSILVEGESFFDVFFKIFKHIEAYTENKG